MASCLMRLSPDRAAPVRALAWDIESCGFPHSVSLHPGVTLRNGLASHPGGSKTTPRHFMLQKLNRDKLPPDEPLGSFADLTFTTAFTDL